MMDVAKFKEWVSDSNDLRVFCGRMSLQENEGLEMIA